MKSLLIGLVSVVATVALANNPPAETTATQAPAGDAKVEAPKDAAHADAAAAHGDKKAEKKAKKNKKDKKEEAAKQ